ncbi:hypothetical protein BFU36_06930 [Sulfolobus sp. A20]|uniref:hypothetical protein n=1 Tax=Saccharolobus sp. A20 TaxID=1891280 RepID=UPI000845E3B2|nr:hypothetical protein [Sulfolobus sp. A20]TRM74775.1 hypothetical protein DJ523_04115 [Sulfolobus sp. E5]TRM79001.1 hypothetical protein DJ528_03175 [Sulfolobus sp. B5]TRM82062.1 hypothetical protein DJ524_02000 [Sulfolobus sp. D5]TRM83588.1 hypothetical protein DJ531_04915 [Sulfolobus sp. A20-N-F6]TRM88329.1 hypothetical protein DJ529_05655 [Sulfolobus sp. C3]TRM95301.1 hypothetical protein DJ526_00695 [Sulfolobus sp. A20-N-G8]TRN01234.1 hypothetical protein DJ530_06170 [Sulfolobus sp. E1
MSYSINDIKAIVENPSIKGFKMSIRKARDFSENNTFQSISKTTVKEGMNMGNMWIKCFKERAECDVVNEKGELFIINFKDKIIIKLEYI